MAGNTGNLRNLYEITQATSGRRYTKNRPIRSKTSELLTNEQAQLDRWREYFAEILNKKSNRENENEDYNDVWSNNKGKLPIDSQAPSVKEIAHAIKHLKNRKAPGVNNIPPELLRTNADIAAQLLYPLFQKIWTTENMLREWREGLLIKLLKKGDTSNCQNWRGITLCSTLCSQQSTEKNNFRQNSTASGVEHAQGTGLGKTDHT